MLFYIILININKATLLYEVETNVCKYKIINLSSFLFKVNNSLLLQIGQTWNVVRHFYDQQPWFWNSKRIAIVWCTECRKPVPQLFKHNANHTSADAVKICGIFWDTRMNKNDTLRLSWGNLIHASPVCRP